MLCTVCNDEYLLSFVQCVMTSMYLLCSVFCVTSIWRVFVLGVMTSAYCRLLCTVCGDEYLLWVYGTLVVTTLHFWLCAAGYMFLDLTGRPHFLTK